MIKQKHRTKSIENLFMLQFDNRLKNKQVNSHNVERNNYKQYVVKQQTKCVKP